MTNARRLSLLFVGTGVLDGPRSQRLKNEPPPIHQIQNRLPKILGRRSFDNISIFGGIVDDTDEDGNSRRRGNYEYKRAIKLEVYFLFRWKIRLTIQMH